MSSKLYVGNLSYNTTDESLAEAFSQAGSVTSARVITDRDSGRSKGFGFVEMASAEDANKAISQFDGAQLDGRAIKVSEAKPQAPREGGRGGFGGGRGGRY